MEQRDGSSTPTGPILAVVGGVLLAIGSVLTWATVSLDLDAFADALGVDPSQLEGSVPVTSSKFAGTSVLEGKMALACGVVAIVIGVIAYARREQWKVLGLVGVVAGGVGAAWALYGVSQKGDVVADAKAAVEPTFASIGLDVSILDSIFKVDLGIGIWMSVLGGIVALLGGLWLMTRSSPSVSMPAMAGMPAAAMAPVPDSGFGTSSVAGSMAAPPTPAAPPPTPAPAPEIPTDAVDAPPSGDSSDSGDAGGSGDAPSP